MIGISMGGIETWLAAAVDDRVKVAVPAISVQSFRWSLENEEWQGRANTIKAAHEAAARPGRRQGQCQGLPGPLEQGDPRHPRPVRLPEHAPPVRRPAPADPQRRARPELPDRRSQSRVRLHQ